MADVGLLLNDPITWALFAVVWASFLWFPHLRTARTVAYLLAVTALFFGVGWAPEPWPLVLRLSVLLSIAAMHFWFDQILSAYPRAVSDFRKTYGAINKRMTAAYADYEQTKTRRPLEMALEQAIADLESLQVPPGDQWQEVRSAAAAVVENRLAMLRDGTDADSGAALRFRTQRAEVHKRFWDALEQSRKFWR